mgnify:CR=1 FL=1
MGCGCRLRLGQGLRLRVSLLCVRFDGVSYGHAGIAVNSVVRLVLYIVWVYLCL